MELKAQIPYRGYDADSKKNSFCGKQTHINARSLIIYNYRALTALPLLGYVGGYIIHFLGDWILLGALGIWFIGSLL